MVSTACYHHPENPLPDPKTCNFLSKTSSYFGPSADVLWPQKAERQCVRRLGALLIKLPHNYPAEGLPRGHTAILLPN